MKTVILSLVLAAFSLNGFAQEKEPRFGVELTGGVSVPLKKVSDATLKVGGGFEGAFHYRFIDHLGAYVGWGWSHFSSENSFAGAKSDFEEFNKVQTFPDGRFFFRVLCPLLTSHNKLYSVLLKKKTSARL